MLTGELLSYDQGFRYIEEKLSSLKALPFLSLCSKEDLERYRRLLRVKKSDKATDKAVREMVLAKFSMASNGYTLEKITKAFKSIGLDCVVSEDTKNGKIKITAIGFLDENKSYERIKEELKKIAPAHLEFDFDIGILTWEMLDKKDLSFLELDENDFSWEEIDLKGHLLEKGKGLNGKHI